MTSPWKNPIRPQPASYGSDGVGEGHALLALPLHHPLVLVLARQQPVQQRHYAVQPQQARLGAQHRPRTPTPRALQAKVGSGLFKGGFDLPAIVPSKLEVGRTRLNGSRACSIGYFTAPATA